MSLSYPGLPVFFNVLALVGNTECIEQYIVSGDYFNKCEKREVLWCLVSLLKKASPLVTTFYFTGHCKLVVVLYFMV